MSLYQFLPSSPRAGSTEPFVTWDGAFSNEELDKINELCSQLVLDQAQITGTDSLVIDDSIRRTKVGWIKNANGYEWIYDRLAYVARSLNSKFYRFNLYGFCEDIQYTVYEATEEGFYDWHVDHGTTTECPRKLSLVLQLSDPSEYEGGELEVMDRTSPFVVDKTKGLIAAFPSYVLHRVTPVTKGVRRTLVVWCCGPEFV